MAYQLGEPYLAGLSLCCPRCGWRGWGSDVRSADPLGWAACPACELCPVERDEPDVIVPGVSS